MQNKLNEQQIEFLIKNYPKHGLKYCAEKLNLPINTVKNKKNRLGLKLETTIKYNNLLKQGKRECSVCKEIKELKDFARDGKRHRADCKICNAEKAMRYFEKHREEKKQYNKEWAKKNKLHLKEYRQKNKEQINQKRRNRYHKDEKFKQRILNNVKKYRENPKNKKKIRETQTRLTKGYMKDPIWRIKQSLRRRMLFVLEGKRKADFSRKLIGCTQDELKRHLESQFKDGMTWENYGFYGWHVDHIIPCNSFDLSKPEQQKKCFHYTNLQPLWMKDNLSKGAKLI